MCKQKTYLPTAAQDVFGSLRNSESHPHPLPTCLSNFENVLPSNPFAQERTRLHSRSSKQFHILEADNKALKVAHEEALQKLNQAQAKTKQSEVSLSFFSPNTFVESKHQTSFPGVAEQPPLGEGEGTEQVTWCARRGAERTGTIAQIEDFQGARCEVCYL